MIQLYPKGKLNNKMKKIAFIIVAVLSTLGLFAQEDAVKERKWIIGGFVKYENQTIENNSYYNPYGGGYSSYGGGYGYGYGVYNSPTDKYKVTDLVLAPSIERQVTKSLSIGTSLMYMRRKNKIERSSSSDIEDKYEFLGISPFVRMDKMFKEEGRLGYFFEFSLGLLVDLDNEVEYETYNTTVSSGLLFNVTDRLYLNLYLVDLSYTNSSANDDTAFEDTDNISFNFFDLASPSLGVKFRL